MLTNNTHVCNHLERLLPCNENQKYIWTEATDYTCQAHWLKRIQLVNEKSTKKKLCSTLCTQLSIGLFTRATI